MKSKEEIDQQLIRIAVFLEFDGRHEDARLIRDTVRALNDKQNYDNSFLLTEDEQLAMQKSGELWNLLGRIVSDGEGRGQDMRELIFHIHAIQHTIMGQAGARAYGYRLLGDGALPKPEIETTTVQTPFGEAQVTTLRLDAVEDRRQQIQSRGYQTPSDLEYLRNTQSFDNETHHTADESTHEWICESQNCVVDRFFATQCFECDNVHSFPGCTMCHRISEKKVTIDVICWDSRDDYHTPMCGKIKPHTTSDNIVEVNCDNCVMMINRINRWLRSK